MELITKISVGAIESSLTNTTFKDEIIENLNGWKEDYNVSEKDYLDTKTWIAGIVQDLLDLARDVEDEDELNVSIFTKYIELKCYWKQLNTQIQYQTFRTGIANVVLIGKASLTTYVLIAIEPLINETELAEIQEFLTKPIREMIVRESTTDIFSEENQANDIALMEIQLDTLYADKEYLQLHLGLTTAEEILESMQSLKDQINDINEEFSDAVKIGETISFTGTRTITIQKTK